MQESSFEGTGGFKIFTHSWRPDGEARAIIVMVHGFNSHGGYFSWAAEHLAKSGLAAYALDLRGRGRSEGERFYIDEFANFVRDVGTLVDAARSENGDDTPVFVLGHSAGGLVACLYALGHQAELAGLISESFAFQVPAPDFALAVLKGLSHIVPHAHVVRLKNADFSRDPAVVGAMDADPLIAGEVQPTQTMAELVRTDERLKSAFPEIALPLLILHGTADKAAKPDGSRFFHETAGSADKTLKLYDGHFHDLLNDLGREAVMADILAWLDARISARPETTAAVV